MRLRSRGLRWLCEQLPPEILQDIFKRTILPNPLVNLTSYYFYPNACWCQVLRQKKTLLNVCLAWYRIALPFLYEEVSIRRIYQLGNLLRTLESPDSMALKHLVKALNVHCFIPRSLEGTFRMQLTRLFAMCPRLTDFSHTSPCYPPLLTVLPSLPPTLTHLQFGEGLDPAILQAILETSSTNLVSLSIYPDLSEANASNKNILFPILESLTFSMLSGNSAMDMDRLASNWELPRLQYLTFQVDRWNLNVVSLNRFGPFFKKYASQLKLFHVHPQLEDNIGCMSNYIDDIQSIVDSCPLLERFVLLPRPVPPITLQHIESFRPGNDTRDAGFGSSGSSTSPGIITAHFPSLKTMRKSSPPPAGWESYFEDLHRNVPTPFVLVGDRECLCLGVDVHDDVGEIFLNLFDGWASEEDEPYEGDSTIFFPASESEEDETDDTDGSVASDWHIGVIPDAEMDLLHTPSR